MQVPPGTIVVYADIACPWAHVAFHRLHETRARLGLQTRIAFDVRAFPLELFNEQPTPKRGLDLEVDAISQAVPEAGWQRWSERDERYPVTMLPPLEAVQAAKQQSLAAAEQLDLRLRLAMFAESRCISMRHEIVACAQDCEAVDVGALTAALDDGRARSIVMEQFRDGEAGKVEGSPHIFLPDGRAFHNPGIESHWEGPKGKKNLVIDRNDASVYDEILAAAIS